MKSNTEEKKSLPGKDDTKQKYQVREGKEDSAASHEKEGLNSEAYPLPEEKDKQVKNQPEFIERNTNEREKTGS
jgi:hypothetical protein